MGLINGDYSLPAPFIIGDYVAIASLAALGVTLVLVLLRRRIGRWPHMAGAGVTFGLGAAHAVLDYHWGSIYGGHALTILESGWVTVPAAAGAGSLGFLVTRTRGLRYMRSRTLHLVIVITLAAAVAAHIFVSWWIG